MQFKQVEQVSEHMETDREASDEDKVAALSGVVSVGEAVWVKAPSTSFAPMFFCTHLR